MEFNEPKTLQVLQSLHYWYSQSIVQKYKSVPFWYQKTSSKVSYPQSVNLGVTATQLPPGAWLPLSQHWRLPAPHEVFKKNGCLYSNEQHSSPNKWEALVFSSIPTPFWTTTTVEGHWTAVPLFLHGSGCLGLGTLHSLVLWSQKVKCYALDSCV